jgi:DNA invertase Pin-like site-specific DNA recombinase
MPDRAVIYLRQSRDREGTHAGVDRQLEDCTALVDRIGATVARVITDNDESADSTRRHRADYRPGYRELLADMEHGACDLVVAWAQDRLLRDVREGEDLIELVNRTGVRIATVQGGDDDLSTADGRMIVRMRAVVAKTESEKKADRQRRQARQSAERGDAPSRRAFGYRNVRTAQGLRAELEPAEAVLVRDAFDRLLRGESLVTITKMLNAAGLPSVRGNHWHRKGARYLLLSPRYAGLREYKGTTVPGQWPAIITADEHARAVALLNAPERKANLGGTARKHLGSGLYRCHCGADVRVGYRSRANGSLRAYVCRSETHTVRRLAEPVDDYVIAVVEERLSRPDVADLVSATDTPELTTLRAEVDRLRGKITRAQRDYDDELIDATDLRAVKARRGAELEVVQRKIAAAARTSRLAQLAAAGDPVQAFRALDLAARRTVIDTLMTVTLLQTTGGRAFDESTVVIAWKADA